MSTFAIAVTIGSAAATLVMGVAASCALLSHLDSAPRHARKGKHHR